MTDKLVAYARLVAIAASQQQLSAEVAQLFCRDAVPRLLAEIEVLGRVNAKFDELLQAPKAEPACESTICSSRWKAPEPPKAEKKARKPRKKKARAK